MRSTSWSAQYLEGPAMAPGKVPTATRFETASALSALTRMLRDGYPAAEAQAHIAAIPRFTQALTNAEVLSATTTLISDFKTITTV